MSRENRSNSSRPFYRVKPKNFDATNFEDRPREQIELVNILNWSPFDDEETTKRPTISKKVSIKDESESKSKQVINTVETSIEIQKLLLRLKNSAVDPTGRLINYDFLRTTNIHRDLSQLTKRLTSVNLENVTENERKTLFINLYNALTIHGIVQLSNFPKSVLDLNQFWKTTAYKVSSDIYSLDDIEHGILRGNKPHSNCTQRHFTFNDPRAKFSMRRCDPRIHFALNFAARSCPQIAVFSSSHLEKSLNMATTSYCNSEIDVQIETNEVFLPKVFLWYRNDFGRSDFEILRWISKFIDEPKRSLIQTLLDQQTTKSGFRIRYKTFDWILNDQKTFHFNGSTNN